MSKNRTNVAVVVAIVLMLATAVLVATRQSQEQSAAAPNDHLLAQVNLGSGPFAEVVVGEFVVAETAVTHLRFTLQNLDTPLFTLSLVDEAGANYTILQAENYRTNQDGGGDWQETLPPGRYQLRLTSAQSAGLVAVYLQSTN